MLAFIALVTYLFVVDPGQSETPLLNELFGPEPPMVLVYFTLLVLWDLCYRIGVSWWIGVVSLWRAIRYPTDQETTATLRRVDQLNIGFGILQVILIPFVIDHPSLVAALVGHIIAVTTFSGLSSIVAQRN